MTEKKETCRCGEEQKDSTLYCNTCGRPFPGVKVDQINAYWEVLPVIKDMARRLGWCLALYGPLRRDLDMIAVPWMEDAVPYERLLGEIIQTFGGRFTSELIEPMSDRKDTTVLCRKRLARDNGSYIDISVVDPRVPKLPRVRG
jgi:hypothetical protein